MFTTPVTVANVYIASVSGRCPPAVPRARKVIAQSKVTSQHGLDADSPAAGEWEATISLSTYDACREYYENHPLKSDEVAQDHVTAVMDHPLYVAKPSDAIGSLEDAFKITSGIPVLNREEQVIGVISARDVHGMPPDTLVADAMTTPVVTAGPEKKIYHIAAMMLKHKIRHIPIVDKHNRLLGEVSAKDIFVALNP